jgi:DNA-directed RNA polymerase specialized sigma24 family protein
MATDANGSVTAWIGRLLAGDGDALAPLIGRYFGPLAAVAERRIPAGGHAGGDDLANSAFVNFWKGAARGRFPNLSGRDELWRLLLHILNQKVTEHHRYTTRDIRLASGVRVDANLDEFASDDPDPLLLTAVDEEFRRVLDVLGEDDLRDIALCKLQGYENGEIAERLRRAPRTVGYKLKLIRVIWQREVRP